MKKQVDLLAFFLAVMSLLIGILIGGLLLFAAMTNDNFLNMGKYIPNLSSQELAQFNQTKVLVLPKTIWDFLQLLIVPFFISIIGYLYTKRRTDLDKGIADDQRNEDILQKYIESVGELILAAGYDKEQENLLFTKNQVVIAEARTLLVMRQLDNKRKSNVIRFLYNSNLIGGILPGMNPFGGKDHARPRILSLKKVDLSSIDLSQADIPGINLSEAILTGANFEKAVMPSSNLLDTEHENIITRDTDFENAVLPHDLEEEYKKMKKR